MVFSHRNSRVVLVCMVVLVVTLSSVLVATSVPPVHACNACNFLLQWGTAGSNNGQFSSPQGVAADSSGNVYVVDKGNNRVEKFASTGVYVSQLGCASGACSGGSGNGQFSGPVGVAVDGSGNVYVVDNGNGRVEKFSNTAAFLLKWGIPGTNNGQFEGPQDIAVDSSGNVYVVDEFSNRVQKFSNTGVYASQLGCPTGACAGGSSAGVFTDPFGVAVDSSGNVYVGDNGNNRIEKFSNTGVFLLSWGSSGSAGGEFSGPMGIALDQSSNVYVVDDVNNRVQKFSSAGVFILQWPCSSGACGSGSGPDQFNQPLGAGVGVDSSGNVYVADPGNSRVELFGDSTLASISLVAGWNLISLPIVPLSTAIGKVLSGLIGAGEITIVWSFQSGTWKFFTPSGSPTLTTMSDGFGYWIYMLRADTLQVLGYTVPPGATPSTYTLTAGWNLAGFRAQSPSQNETITRYLTSIYPKYAIVQVYDNLNATWIEGYPLLQGNLQLAPGEAMWVYMSTPATLVPE